MFSVSVPGSMMLFGEHAVLYGKKAIVTAIDKRINIVLTPNKTKKIKIYSHLGTYEEYINRIKIKKPFDFLLATVDSFIDKIPNGFELYIESDFKDSIGFGSSAAIVVAMYAILNLWINDNILCKLELLKKTKKIVHVIQKNGSGSDLAASIYGGVISYLMDTYDISHLSFDEINFSAVYCGYKKPTSEVIEIVKKRVDSDKQKYYQLFDSIEKCTLEAFAAIRNKDCKLLGKLMNANHEFMVKLGLSDSVLDKLNFILRNDQNIYGSKISGSGLGDCLIGLGNFDEKLLWNELLSENKLKNNEVCHYRIKSSPNGLVYEF